MNARTTLAWTLALALALATSAQAQTSSNSLTAPLPMLSPGLTWDGQAAPAPAAVPKVVRGTGSSDWDQQVPPPPPMPPAAVAPSSGTVSATAPQAQKVQMTTGVPFPAQKGQLMNVRVEFTIADQIGTKPPTRKTMTLIMADRESGRIRTTTTNARATSGTGWTVDRVPLSVDVQPTIDGGKIRLEFTLEYELSSEKEPGLPAEAPGLKTNVSERLSAVLDSGVPLVIAQSSEPLNDRKLTVEVKATIVK